MRIGAGSAGSYTHWLDLFFTVFVNVGDKVFFHRNFLCKQLFGARVIF